MEEVDLEFTDDALDEISKQSIKRKTGARGLRTILEKILLNTMYELPSMKDVSKIIIEQKTVKEAMPPTVVYKQEQMKKAM
jgi:ATP-dependent Clp protease ATP-binding subunit ClpX